MPISTVVVPKTSIAMCAHDAAQPVTAHAQAARQMAERVPGLPVLEDFHDVCRCESPASHPLLLGELLGRHRCCGTGRFTRPLRVGLFGDRNGSHHVARGGPIT